MQGFFSKKETQSAAATKGKIHSCAACGLYKNCRSPKMKPFGNFRKGIMNIGEAPGGTDDERGKPWQGKAGRLLKRTYAKFGIDLFEDCINVNAVNCRPISAAGANRPPTSDEIAHCRSVIVLKAIQKYQPKVIVLLGGAAIDSVIGHRWAGNAAESVNKWRGWTIPDQDFKCWICPTFHPSYLDQIGLKKEYMTIWEQDLERAISKVEEPWPRAKKPEIEIVSDLRFLDNHASAGLIAFDYETTGIKPHAKGHRIRTVAIADREDHCWAFVMPKTRKERAPFRRWLKNPDVAKMAHNMKFEETWSRVIIKQPVQGWEWDSMLAAHLLDNRTGISGLKFQTYVNFGVIDYSSEVDPFLRSTKAGDGGNAINKIDDLLKTKAGVEKLLEYNALDSVYEYRLALKQMEKIDYDYLPF